MLFIELHHQILKLVHPYNLIRITVHPSFSPCEHQEQCSMKDVWENDNLVTFQIMFHIPTGTRDQEQRKTGECGLQGIFLQPENVNLYLFHWLLISGERALWLTIYNYCSSSNVVSSFWGNWNFRLNNCRRTTYDLIRTRLCIFLFPA